MSFCHNTLKAANVAALLSTFSIGFYFSDHGHKEIVNLTPATYTFAIWGIIYVLLVGFIIYQWFESANDATVDGIGYYYVLASILSMTWLTLWENGYYFIDVFVAMSFLATLSLIYRNLSLYPPKNLADRLFIHYPFTIYTAWIFVATIVNFWVAIKALDTVLLSTVAVIVIGLVGLYFVDGRQDIVFAATLAWSLIGIAVRHHETLPILAAASASSGLILGVILRDWVRNIVAFYHHRGSNSERAPLL